VSTLTRNPKFRAWRLFIQTGEIEMTFPASRTLFAAAASTTSSPEDTAFLERISRLQKEDPKLPDDELDKTLAAVIREHMRAGKNDFYIEINDRNSAELELIALRLRQSGFTAEANPGLPRWCKFLLISRGPCIRVSWNPAELAAAVLLGDADRTH